MKWITLFLVGWASMTGCVVTDEIKFEDKVNYPPQLVQVDPPNNRVNYAESGQTIAFQVTVMDPNPNDLFFYDGRISVIEQLNTSTNNEETFSCNSPTEAEVESAAVGIAISTVCQVTIRPINETTENLMIKMVLSDRGFLAGNVPVSEAKTLEVMWIYALLPKSEF